MKKIFTLVLVLVSLSSCTTPDMAETSVMCPCTIEGIEVAGSVNDAPFYYVKVESLMNKRYLKFYTTHKYNLNDTIK